jgi:hypothetical protein
MKSPADRPLSQGRNPEKTALTIAFDKGIRKD